MRVNPALNGYLKKSGKINTKGGEKHRTTGHQSPLYFLPEGPRNGDQH